MERQTVLIVDDSELNRMMLMEILGEQYHYIESLQFFIIIFILVRCEE